MNEIWDKERAPREEEEDGRRAVFCSVLCTIYSLHSQQAEFRTVPFYHRTVVVVAVITTTSHQVKNAPLRSERGYDDDDYSRS